MKKETRALSHEELVEIEERIRDVLEQYFGTQFQVSIKRKKRIKVKCKSTEQPVKSLDMYVEDSSHTEIATLKKKNEELQNENKELKEKYANAEKTILDNKAEIKHLQQQSKEITSLKKKNKTMQKDSKPFEELISLYQKAKTINEFCPLSLDLESPLKFLFCVASEQAVGSLYEKLRYNYKAVSKKASVAIELYNELVDFMCSINPKFAAIDELGEMDDEHHAEINQKHEGQIKTILMKGYQYSVSGTVEKKAFVEAI